MLLTTVISISLSVAAFIFSVFTWRERKSKDQRDLFLRMHERLIDIDLQRGRRILGEAVRSPQDAQTLFRDSPDEYDLANRALAMLDVAALYAERGFIDKSLFMEEWGAVYRRIFEPAQNFISERAKRIPAYTHTHWPHLQKLANEARRSVPDKGLSSLGDES